METIRRFFEPPHESFFLFGPRGTGKSTLVKERFPDALYIDFLDPEVFRIFSARPEHLRERLLAATNIRTVIIDEIQKVPEMLSLIHALIEEKRGWQFVLTGSSSRKLKRAGVDLLAGRALLHSLHPFVAPEISDTFNLIDALNKGMLPIVLDSSNPEQVLQTYAALYLREEVQMEGLVRNIGNFSRFSKPSVFHMRLCSISVILPANALLNARSLKDMWQFWRIFCWDIDCAFFPKESHGPWLPIANSTCSTREFIDL